MVNWLYEEGEDCSRQIYSDKLDELRVSALYFRIHIVYLFVKLRYLWDFVNLEKSGKSSVVTSPRNYI